MTVRAAVIGPPDSATWTLFTDWCMAAGRSPLPADPITLAEFLAAHPAADPTQRRRVGTVNAAHRRAGHPAPGRSQAVRDLLDARAPWRRHRKALAAAAAIAMLPETGWPTALFARRDAMILTLSGAGLPNTVISALTMGDVRAEGGGELLEIDTGVETLTAGTELVSAGVSPAKIWQAWADVRRIQHHLPSTRRVAQLIEGKSLPATAPAAEDAPLLVPLDRWGATPLVPEPLSADAIGVIAAGHLQGRPTRHKPVNTSAAHAVSEETAQLDSAPIILDQDTLARGLEARRRASELLAGVDDELDDVEARADALLVGLLELLDDPGPRN